MTTSNPHNDLIIKYLSGGMAPDERSGFEQQLRSDSKLREEYRELLEIHAGLSLIDQIHQGHFDPEILVEYADTPSELDDDVRRSVEEHIRDCQDCADEVRLCRQTADLTFGERVVEERESIIEKIKRVLFATRFAFRPAYGIIALLLVTAPILFVVLNSTRSSSSRTAPFQLVDTGVRAGEIRNEIVLSRGAGMVVLEFMAPIRNDRFYNFELYNSDNRLIFAKGSNPPLKTFVLEIPASYIPSEGVYVLRVKETGGDGVEDLAVFALDLRYAD